MGTVPTNTTQRRSYFRIRPTIFPRILCIPNNFGTSRCPLATTILESTHLPFLPKDKILTSPTIPQCKPRIPLLLTSSGPLRCLDEPLRALLPSNNGPRYLGAPPRVLSPVPSTHLTCCPSTRRLTMDLLLSALTLDTPMGSIFRRQGTFPPQGLLKCSCHPAATTPAPSTSPLIRPHLTLLHQRHLGVAKVSPPPQAQTCSRPCCPLRSSPGLVTLLISTHTSRLTRNCSDGGTHATSIHAPRPAPIFQGCPVPPFCRRLRSFRAAADVQATHEQRSPPVC